MILFHGGTYDFVVCTLNGRVLMLGSEIGSQPEKGWERLNLIDST